MTFRTKIRDGQIILPGRLQTLAGLADGDPLDITFERGRFIVTPHTLEVNSELDAPSRKEVLAAFRSGLKDLRRDAEARGSDKTTMRQINAGIAASRRDRRKRERESKQPSK